MDLERQLAELIEDAANYGVPPVVIEKAIAPVLRQFANQLQHSEYYILQNLEQDWVLTTIANPKLKQEKRLFMLLSRYKMLLPFKGQPSPT